ncbi:NusA-like transcription termination signal-binding factor [Candidatus Woesearchaeota archaeon]|nr:NusA-like transcription termination signal-binding factor [Candidatus Woesearchaeota archaeon]
MKITYDADSIKYIALIETLSRVKVKDLFMLNGILCCVVSKSDMSKLIGSNGVKIKKIQNMLKKRIKVIGFDDDINEFVKNYLHPLKVDKIENQDSNLIISCKDSKTKGLLIGRSRSGLIDLKRVVSRYFNINEIKIK